MTTSLNYTEMIKHILLEHSHIKPAHGDIDTTVSFDDDRANYVLLQPGWDGDSYLHGAAVHISIIGGKIWIQYYGTEEGVATELLEMGAPKAHIFLGWGLGILMNSNIRDWQWLKVVKSSLFSVTSTYRYW